MTGVAREPVDVVRWTRIAIALVATTLFYNVAEAVVALWSGSEAESVALLGFGFDSLIETAAASIVLWRLLYAKAPQGESIERVEHRVHQFVGATFVLLALYVVSQAGWTLWHHDEPAESAIGIGLAVASLVLMPLVSVAKLRAAAKLQSRALRAEAKETLACSYLSATLLLGLLLNALLGWWWADVAALLMVPWLIKEAREGLQGESCEDD